MIASYEYTIGSNGERLSCTELGRAVEYTYDALERLTSETVTVGTDVSVTSYTYDANSNRLSMTRDGEVTNYTYNSLNQITQAGDISYTWDNAGNLVSQSRNGVIAATYIYDCHNRMISANINSISGTIVESYTYDYLGNRTSKTTDGETTYFTTDLSSGYSQVLKAENSSETIYYTRGFELISRRAGQDAHYYLFDGGMSVRGLTDESGVVTDTFVFDAFGNELARTGNTDNSYGFQGEEKDATGLYYLRARYMDPSTGTFTSMDTYRGSLSDPMSLHKYLFANSNPVKYCDPSGHFSLVDFELSEAIDEILMSSLNYGFTYIGFVNKNTTLSNGEKITGYLAALGLGLLMPFVFSAIALLPFVTALLLCVLIVEVVTIAAYFADSNGNHIVSKLLGLVAFDTVGHIIGMLIQALIKWINTTDAIHIEANDVGGGSYQDYRGRWRDSNGRYSSPPWEEPTVGDHYLSRPYIRRSTIDAVNNRTIVDYQTGEIWDEISGMWVDPENVELGHTTNNEFWYWRNWAESQGMTQAEFNDFMNNPDFYAWQDITSNRSHAFEAPH